MVEIRPVPRLCDHLPRGGIHVTQPHAGLDQRFGGKVGAVYQLMHGSLLFGGGSRKPGAGHIAAIAVFAAAHIHQHALPGLQNGVVRLVVGVGGVRAEGHDRRKAVALAAVGKVLLVHKAGHLLFGHTHPHILLDGGVDLVIDAACLAHQRLLGFVLAGAAIVHAVACQHHPHTGAVLHQRNQKFGSPLLVDAQGRGGIDHPGDLRHGVLRIIVPHSLAGRVRHVEQPVQKQHRLPANRQIQRQQPLVRLYLHPGQIPHTFGVGYDHLCQPLHLHGGAHTLDTLVHFQALLCLVWIIL